MLSPQDVKDIRDGKIRLKITFDKQAINDYIWGCTNGIVQTGPFTGMKLPVEEIWKDGNAGNKCLGTYEQELHQIVEDQISKLKDAEKILKSSISGVRRVTTP